MQSEVKMDKEELTYNINPNQFENKEGKALDYNRLIN